jgi:hypothetical protein
MYQCQVQLMRDTLAPDRFLARQGSVHWANDGTNVKIEDIEGNIHLYNALNIRSITLIPAQIMGAIIG